MASSTASLISLQSRPGVAISRISNRYSSKGTNFLSFSWNPIPVSLHVCHAAKQETLDKVCGIVKKQLALSDDTAVTGESKFSSLGADSLDTVEIVMGIEEAFGISVEEESAQTIATVQDAADLVETLIEKNA